MHPIAAVQSEFSILTGFVDSDWILDTCEDPGIALVAYSPLGRGMFAGWSKSWKAAGFDFRATTTPRFQGEAPEANLALLEEIPKVATDVDG